jgi:hypothetical protein
MKPGNITSRSLIIAWLSERNKTTAPDYVPAFERGITTNLLYIYLTENVRDAQ